MKSSRLLTVVLGLALSIGFTSTFAYDRDRERSYRDDDREYSDRYYRCNSCGRVERIEYAGRRHNSGGGAVAGAIIGGALGNQVGDGDGRRAATIAGAVLGGIAGNNAERRSSNRRNVYDILVRMDRGRSIWVTQSELRGVREGSRVEVRNGRVRLR
jgi:outer membrane lipoprotein SlyB